MDMSALKLKDMLSNQRPFAGKPLELDTQGGTSLHYIVQASEWTLIPTLLQLGVDINAPNAQGDTALHLAARQGCKLTYRLLLQCGADPTIRNRHNETAEMLFSDVH